MDKTTIDICFTKDIKPSDNLKCKDKHDNYKLSLLKDYPLTYLINKNHKKN